MSERALAITLLHFLWQGAALGLVAAAALHLARRPAVRYALGCGFLLAMAAAPVFTYLTLARERLVLDIDLVATSVAAATTAAASVNWNWTPVLAQFWTAGSSLMLLRSAGGWLLAWRRTRRGQTALLGVRGRVRIFESLTAQAPYVFGALRPVVLIPASALLRLTPEQLEAVIEHELAHIRRHDYAVNVVQTLIEGLLFYHPAVWWLSARIRHERELCCDEAAVALCGDRVVYSRALLELEQVRGEFALAATGGRLSDRIGRILGMEQKSISLAPALSAAAVVALWSGLVWAQKEPAKPAPPAPPAPAVAPAPPDTVVVDGKVYRKKTLVEKPAKPAAPHQPPLLLILPTPAKGSGSPADELRALDQQMSVLQKQLQELAARRQQLQQQASGLDAEARSLERQQFEHQKAVEKIERQAQKQAMSADRTEAEAKLAQMLARQKEMELERRIRYADERFKEDGKRGSETDRGKVYLKYGPPDEIETHASEGRDAWLYRSGPIIRFVNGKLVSIDAAI